jgi:hypothetical protein
MERINKLEAEVSKLHNELMETKQMAQQQEMVLTFCVSLAVFLGRRKRWAFGQILAELYGSRSLTEIHPWSYPCLVFSK